MVKSVIGPFTILILLVLGGCSNMTTLENGDCWVFVGEAEFHGRVTESSVEGKAYVRKGSCSAEDIAAALDATD